jgi:hypothetical protein
MKPSRYAIEIPKKIIQESAVMAGPDSTYHSILKACEAFEEADMTPIFLYDKAINIIFCVAKETYEKKLH